MNIENNPPNDQFEVIRESAGKLKTVLQSVRDQYELKLDELSDLKDLKDKYLAAPEPRQAVVAMISEDIDRFAQNFDKHLGQFITEHAMRRSKNESSGRFEPFRGIQSLFMTGGVGNHGIDSDAVIGVISSVIKKQVSDKAKKMEWPGSFDDGLSLEERDEKISDLDKEIALLEAEVDTWRNEIESAGGRFAR